MKFRTGFLTAIERDTLWELFETDQAQQYVILELEEAIWPAAQRLLFQYPLKASDALHIALALVAQRRGAGADLHFWTADQQQARAAEAEGLTVELLA